MVKYQAGTRLVKQQTGRTFYVVEPEGMLRPISKYHANVLFGDDWSALVDPIDDLIFHRYVVGEPLELKEIPNGMFLKDNEGDLYRSYDQKFVQINGIIAEELEPFYKQFAIDEDELSKRLQYYYLSHPRLVFFSDQALDTFFSKMAFLMKPVIVSDKEKSEIIEFKWQDAPFEFEIWKGERASDQNLDRILDTWDYDYNRYQELTKKEQDGFWKLSYDQWVEEHPDFQSKIDNTTTSRGSSTGSTSPETPAPETNQLLSAAYDDDGNLFFVIYLGTDGGNHGVSSITYEDGSVVSYMLDAVLFSSEQDLNDFTILLAELGVSQHQ